MVKMVLCCQGRTLLPLCWKVKRATGTDPADPVVQSARSTPLNSCFTALAQVVTHGLHHGTCGIGADPKLELTAVLALNQSNIIAVSLEIS